VDAVVDRLALDREESGQEALCLDHLEGFMQHVFGGSGSRAPT